MTLVLVTIIAIILSFGEQTRSSYSASTSRRRRCQCHPHSPTRRLALISFLSIVPVAIGPSDPPAANADDRSPRPSSTGTGTAYSSSENDILQIKEATKALSSLIDNWSRATTECIYADVPRELLESKNKDRLLEKASEFALFDKSTSVVSCKRTNTIVLKMPSTMV